MFLRESRISRWSFSSALFLGGILSGSVLTGVVMASQPHMEAAIQSLSTARQELNAATPDKAGHRIKAINLVDKAISETQRGIAAAQ